MKREILFKGKRADNKEWVEGLFFKTSFSTAKAIGLTDCIQVIEDISYKTFEILPETLCQYTGKAISLKHPMFNDKLKLFENDVITLGNSKTKYKIVFENFEWIGISNEGDDWGPYECRLSQIREEIHIVGNLIDNPKIMNGAD